jgi:peptidoglycan hydrolase-like protein with peptidoglycan-binding domain
MPHMTPPVPQSAPDTPDLSELGLVLIRPGDTGNAVRTIQARLSELGFFHGVVDGVYGSFTAKSVMAFQRANGLPPTGAVDHATLAALGYEVDNNNAPPSPSSGSISLAEVAKLFPDVPLINLQKYLPLVLQALNQLGLGDLQMVLMALATIKVETGCFAPIDEYQSKYNTAPGGKPFALYDFRADLGNNAAGDGARFKGRGFVQLTGRNNYERYSYEVGLDDQLLRTPEAANEPIIAARILAAYLKDHETVIRNALSRGDLAAARKAVNGGTHGLEQFQLAFQKGMALA